MFFLRGVCNKVLKPNYLDYLQSAIIEVLCLLQKIFPPNLFDIMVHLPIHRVDKFRLGGLAVYQWMYFVGEIYVI